MSLRRFLNVAYAILVEEYQRLGVDLISALAKIEELAEANSTVPSARAVPRVVAASNEVSMSALQGMLQGVQGAPGRRGRRT